MCVSEYRLVNKGEKGKKKEKKINVMHELCVHNKYVCGWCDKW